MSRRKGGRGFILTLLIITLLLLTHLWQKLYVTELSQKIHSLSQTKERIEEENKKLQVRWAQLSNPQRMERMAQRWGFYHPSPQDVALLINSSAKPEQRGILTKLFRRVTNRISKRERRDAR